MGFNSLTIQVTVATVLTLVGFITLGTILFHAKDAGKVGADNE